MASISEAIVRGMHTSLIKNIVAKFNPVETDGTTLTGKKSGTPRKIILY
jgi:hypothetical protein